MNLSSSLPTFARWGVRTVVILAGIIGFASTGFASCGDYLLHGSVSDEWAASDEGSSEPREQQEAGRQAGEGSTSGGPLEPTSPCVGGRCQSLPWGPVGPVTVPVTGGKLIAAAFEGASFGGDIRLLRWCYPRDGALPIQPWLTVDVPPPETV